MPSRAQPKDLKSASDSESDERPADDISNALKQTATPAARNASKRPAQVAAANIISNAIAAKKKKGLSAAALFNLDSSSDESAKPAKKKTKKVT